MSESSNYSTKSVYRVPNGRHSEADLREYKEALYGGEWLDKVERVAAFYAKRDPDRLFDYIIDTPTPTSQVADADDKSTSPTVIEAGRSVDTIGDVYLYLALQDLGLGHMSPQQYRDRIHALRCKAGEEGGGLEAQLQELRKQLSPQ